MANNPDLGIVKCAHCGQDAVVRCSVKGKLYYNCSPSDTHEGCGLINVSYKGGQKWLKENTVFYPQYAAAYGEVIQEPEPDHQEPDELETRDQDESETEEMEVKPDDFQTEPPKKKVSIWDKEIL